MDPTGARRLFLPPYAPDFDLNENAFAKLKVLLREAAGRTITDHWRVTGESIDAFSPHGCANDVTAAGYEPG